MKMVIIMMLGSKCGHIQKFNCEVYQNGHKPLPRNCQGNEPLAFIKFREFLH
jgi:hypothetical protein